ncbi:MAG: hypothetical protein GY702_20610 [Desulfobulbaceae bacterium]|nr:hypothetical protein [Desulfobulbaceae bacterium]
MIDATNSNPYNTGNFLNKNHDVSNLSFNKSKVVSTQENIQLKSDKVSLSYSQESVVTYNSSMSLNNKVDDGFNLLRGLVLNIFEDQGIDYKVQTGDAEIDISELTPVEAEELIADDGYFGVEKTSERIFDLAVGIAGGDPARLDAIKEGVEQGFQEALDSFGGWLPDISYNTYDAVMEKLDNWAGVE